LRSANELTPAVGNMKVNARGDEIGPGGKILRTREQIVSSYYENNPKATPDVDNPKQPAKAKASAPVNPPSQTMKVEDTPVSEVVKEVEPEPEVKKEEVSQEQAEEAVLDKGVEAVQRARSRRRGISDATGE
jgi:FtsZ-interacting cell division protein ZipA